MRGEPSCSERCGDVRFALCAVEWAGGVGAQRPGCSKCWADPDESTSSESAQLDAGKQIPSSLSTLLHESCSSRSPTTIVELCMDGLRWCGEEGEMQAIIRMDHWCMAQATDLRYHGDELVSIVQGRAIDHDCVLPRPHLRSPKVSALHTCDPTHRAQHT
jgi:hypothetical protein